MASMYIETAEEAAKIMLEIVKTPGASAVQFKFDMEVDSIPYVEYRVKRFVKVDDKEECD